MRHLLLAGAIAALTALSAVPTFAQEKRPELPPLDKSPLDLAWLPREAPGSDKAEDAPVARVLYSRPQKNGRTLFAADDKAIVPLGKVWRTGANESTELRVYKSLSLGGKKLAPGFYSLFTIPGEKEWTIIVNSATDGWGAYAYDQKKDVARVTAPVTTAATPAEAFTIVFRQDGAGKATMRLVWDTTEVDVPMAY